MSRAQWQKVRRERLERQRAQIVDNGFVGDHHRGRVVEKYLVKRHKFSPKRARIGGQLAAAGSEYNFQGSRRIAELQDASIRTSQRTNKALEDLGLIESLLVERDHKLPEHKEAVRHPQIVRKVTKLVHKAYVWSAGWKRGYETEADPHQRSAAAADVTAEHFAALGARAAEFDPVLAAMLAELARKRPRAAPAPRTYPPSHADPEVDEWDRETARREQALQDREARERGPPPRD
jgi:hypothetical protein